jgi:hypothetical protein
MRSFGAGNVAQLSFSLCKNDENLVSLYSYTFVEWKFFFNQFEFFT